LAAGRLCAFDFKKQPDGSLTYFTRFDNKFHVLDNTYSQTNTIAAPYTYTAEYRDVAIRTDARN